MAENALYYGDNLTVLRNLIQDESSDLVYLDPPFNSQATYNVLFKAPSGEEGRERINIHTERTILVVTVSRIVPPVHCSERLTLPH